MEIINFHPNYTRLSVKKKSTFFDLLFNYISLLIGGVSGIFINIYISYYYGPKGLGVFNQIYAFYVILSQFSAGGIHLSALKHVAAWQGSSAHLSRIAWSALCLSLPISGLFVFLCYMASFFLPNSQVSQGLRYASLGLVFFSCNKIMLFTLNALQEMRLLSFWQGVRFILMILFVFILIHFENTIAVLGLIFTFSESVLFLGLLLTNLYKLPQFHRGLNCHWMKAHFFFGLRGFCNGLLLEINTRVDILLLGIFTNDMIVGLYSFASMLIEGILGLLVVVRNQINPLLAKLLKEKNTVEIKNIFKKISVYMYLFSFLIFIIAMPCYDFVFSFLLHLNSFSESRYFFLILLSGVCIYSAYFPFDNMLMLAGYPEKQSLLAFFATATNITLNLCFMPLAGAYGAALATSLAMILTLLYLKIMIKKCLNFSL
jgi:O-antigen/teichoic acid export membrane protein